MYSWGPYGRSPYSRIPDLPPLTAVVTSTANAVSVYIAEVVLASGTAYRFGTEEYATLATDSRPSVPFNGTLAKAPSYTISIKSSSTFGGAASGYGPLSVNNASGEYDALLAAATDGALVTIWLVHRGGSFDQGVVLATGMVDGKPEDDGEILTIHFKDDNKRLEIPAQPNVYGGTGGLDGDSNAKGKTRPICLGAPPNVTLQLIDAVKLIYQGHDGAMTGWSHVYDRGVEIAVDATADYANYAALDAATITAGRWASCNAVGCVRFGAKPDGVVAGTPSGGAVSNGMVAGYPTAGVALTKTASLIHWLITNNASANVLVDAASVIAVDATQTGPVGYFLEAGGSKTLRQVADELLAPFLGFFYLKPDRSLSMGIFGLPTGVVAADFSEKDWFGSVKLMPLPSEFAVPPRRVFAAYSRNFTIQADVDSTVDASTQTLRKDPYSIAVSSDAATAAAIAAAYPNSTDSAVIQSWYLNSADAVTLCNTVLVLKGGAVRALLRADLTEVAFSVKIGDVMRLTDNMSSPRYGLGTPRSLTVTEVDNGYDDGVISVEGFGVAA